MTSTKKIIIKIFILVLLALSPIVAMAVDASLPDIKNPFDNLQVKIPGMERFSEAEIVNNDNEINIYFNWIGEYLIGIYNYAIAVVGVFAVVAMAIGGVIWIMSFGNPSLVSVGKDWVVSSLLGLALALGSYIILHTINEDFVNFKPLGLAYIEEIGDLGDSPSGDSYNGPSGSPYTKKTGSVPCPPAQYLTSVNSYVNYYLTQKRIDYKQEKRDRCYDDGTCYLDCSSFVRHMAECLHLNSVNGEGRTLNLFVNSVNNRRPITDCDHPDSFLRPGDLVGLNGHVLTYIGNNQMAECGGGFPYTRVSGKKNGCISVVYFDKRCKAYTRNHTLYYINR